MTGYLRTLLPVIWLLVSTLIALLLYRSSSALFEEERASQGGVRRVRLVGSVTIAALAFLGVWRATPTSILTGQDDDHVGVATTQLVASHRAAAALDDAVNKIAACVTNAPIAQCPAERAQLAAAAQAVAAADLDLAKSGNQR